MKLLSAVFLTLIVLFLGGSVYFLWDQQQVIINTLETEKTAAPAVGTVKNNELQPTQSSELRALEASVSALANRLADIETELAEATTSQAPTQSSFQNFSRQILYLGSANTTAREWQASNLEITLNSTDYPNNVDARFEAGLSILGGVAGARLVNTTTGAILSQSEVFHGTSTVTWKSSPSFQLHPGNNTYRVELRSSSGETAQLSGARLILE